MKLKKQNRIMPMSYDLDAMFWLYEYGHKQRPIVYSYDLLLTFQVPMYGSLLLHQIQVEMVCDFCTQN